MPIDTNNADFINQVANENPVKGSPDCEFDRNCTPRPTYGYTPYSIISCAQASACTPESIAHDIHDSDACLSEEPSSCSEQQITIGLAPVLQPSVYNPDLSTAENLTSTPAENLTSTPAENLTSTPAENLTSPTSEQLTVCPGGSQADGNGKHYKSKNYITY
jgi:hypothetical protein